MIEKHPSETELRLDNAETAVDQMLVESPVDQHAEPIRQLKNKIAPLLASIVVHGLIFFFFLAVILNINENQPGASFTVGRGEVGRPADLQTIEALNDPSLVERPLTTSFEELQQPLERPVKTPEVTLRQPEIAPDLAGPMDAPASVESLESLVSRQWSAASLSSRSPGMKKALLKSEGGTPESEMAVERGLQWLSDHQLEDGSWSLSPGDVCQNDACGLMEIECREAATGLALLPFLGAGHVPGDDGPYARNVERGLRWLVSRVNKQGRIIPENAPVHFHMYAHAIATIVLCEASALKPGGPWVPAARRAAQYIINAQNRQDGGWRYFPGDPGDTSVFGWQVMALRSSKISGLSLPKSTQTLARRWLKSAQASTDGSVFAYQPGRPASPVMTAEAILCRQLFGDSPRSRSMNRGTLLVYQDLQRTLGQRNYYYWYYATQLMHNTGGKVWENWNNVIREKLISEQISNAGFGHSVGSWQPLEPFPDRWGRSGGPIMQTSLALLTLEIYYRYLPMYQVDLPKPEDEPDKASARD
ncbi:MAG: hypothetical protein RJA81_1939 [Planctomycetota bacterium]